jgi:hypothetical protein
MWIFFVMLGSRKRLLTVPRGFEPGQVRLVPGACLLLAGEERVNLVQDERVRAGPARPNLAGWPRPRSLRAFAGVTGNDSPEAIDFQAQVIRPRSVPH